MVDDTSSRAVFARIGGHPVLDLINTVQWRLSAQRREDDLGDDEDVVRWSRQAALITDDEADALSRLVAAEPEGAREELSRVRRLREAVYAALFEAAAPDAVMDEYRDAVGVAALDGHDDHWGLTLPRDLALPRRRIALAALDLLTRSPLSQLGQCQDAECGWVFLDTSARRNRRWCVSADCGNRNRVRDYYARSRAATGAREAANRSRREADFPTGGEQPGRRLGNPP